MIKVRSTISSRGAGREPASGGQRQVVAVFGDLGLDTSVSIDRLPIQAGDTFPALASVIDVIGGAAANVACCLTSLGHEVRLGSVIGHDELGGLVLERIRERGISTTFVHRDWPATARTVVLVDQHGNRRCLSDPKLANEYRYPEDRIDEAFGESEWVFVSTQSWCRHVARRAVTTGRRVAVDVQAISGLDEYHRDFLDWADVVVLSTASRARYSHELIRHLWNENEVSVVVATHGAGGATLGVRSSGAIIWEPAYEVRAIVDRAGAGDAFTAGFLSSVMRRRSWREALSAGQLAAAWTIGERGSSQGHPSRARLDELLAARLEQRERV